MPGALVKRQTRIKRQTLLVTPREDERTRAGDGGGSVAAYLSRVRRILPRWPEEVLREWLHRHPGDHRYAFLDYRRFRFSKVTLSDEATPGAEAFYDGWRADFGSNLEERAAPLDRRTGLPLDFLAEEMLKRGTWPSPIVVLYNHGGGLHFPRKLEALKRPLHLLEGHRRLSFLIRLRELGRAAPTHELFIVTLRPPR